jgi:hypothetical protein
MIKIKGSEHVEFALAWCGVIRRFRQSESPCKEQGRMKHKCIEPQVPERRLAAGAPYQRGGRGLRPQSPRFGEHAFR